MHYLFDLACGLKYSCSLVIIIPKNLLIRLILLEQHFLLLYQHLDNL